LVGRVVVRAAIKTVAGIWEQARGMVVAAALVAEVSFDV